MKGAIQIKFYYYYIHTMVVVIVMSTLHNSNVDIMTNKRQIIEQSGKFLK